MLAVWLNCFLKQLKCLSQSLGHWILLATKQPNKSKRSVACGALCHAGAQSTGICVIMPSYECEPLRTAAMKKLTMKQNWRRQAHGNGLRVDVPHETVPDWHARLILTNSILGRTCWSYRATRHTSGVNFGQTCTPLRKFVEHVLVGGSAVGRPDEDVY